MQKPKQFDRNLIVIGAGAAGLVSAYIAAAVKAKVTLIEAGEMGGDCLNTGCVPSKALIKCARVAQQARDAGQFGVSVGDPEIDFPAVMAHVRQSIEMIEPHDSVERYTGLGVEVLQGYAKLQDPWTVQVKMHDGSEQTLTGRAIVVATGASPVVPPLPGLDQVGYVTSETLWDRFAGLERAPERLLVLGGGAIGCELAQAFARLGVKVMLVEKASRLLPAEDEAVSEVVAEALTGDGVTVLTGTEAQRFEVSAAQGAAGKAVVKTSEGEQTLAFDQLLLALGRRPRVQGFGLEELGLLEDGRLKTDAFLRTDRQHILAAGDLVGPYQFTHMASHQAWYAAVNGLFGDLKKFRVDYSVVPRAVFVDPEVASVGITERQAQEQGVAYEVTRYDLEQLDRAIVEGSRRGFVKVLTARGKDRILGAAIVGENAAELIAEFVLAMKHGLGMNKLLGTIHVYPTMMEANRFAAGDWKRANAPKKALQLLEWFHRWRRG
ncbi:MULTISPECIES: NAD(P)/FAD-dependent oxidoreductase [Microbulbifer]|uniref:dihydrolipoyl dehydrogenase family protein n=1 Tax=Microbulbifer TaxID=48073 RepID=UPI0007489933|nr:MULTISPECIES: FAD-dependent oxidoreductase [Microbulbifer]KUJ84172.1 pyridine nucleotide-disulfide oxidoreductase [Microbulbifer sp. ZGT114]